MLGAIKVPRGMIADNACKVAENVPIDFIKVRWKPLVLTDDGINRRYSEICVLSELKNALHSGDTWDASARLKVCAAHS